MRLLAKLEVSSKRYLEIKTENENHHNYLFDEITVYYYIEDKCIILFNDFLCEGIKALFNITSKLLNNNLNVDRSDFPKGIGYQWNLFNNSLANDMESEIEDTTMPYSLWSTTSKYGNETWMYSSNGIIYFEASKNYKWHFDDPREGEDFITFTEFIAKYEPYDVVQVTIKNIEEWNMKCKEIIENMK